MGLGPLSCITREQYFLYITPNFFLTDEDKLQQLARSEFITIHDTHWGIETFHRAIKQVCGICRFMVRDSHAIPHSYFLLTSSIC